jgi:hypothetical protein
LTKGLLMLAGVGLLLPACSNGTAHMAASSDADSAGDPLIVPEDLSVTALAGGNGVLEMIALTLRAGANGAELYAALRNEGDIPACSAAVSVELFDDAEQSLAAGIGGLLTQRFYRLTDGSGTIAACVGPGDVSMAAVMGLPPDIVVEDVRHVVYRCPYFALEVVAIEGLTVSQLEPATGDDGTAFTGTLVNGFDVAVSNPSVTVFPVSRAGRPLGVATGSGRLELPPGGSWTFETSAVATPGADHIAYPAGALAN